MQVAFGRAAWPDEPRRVCDQHCAAAGGQVLLGACKPLARHLPGHQVLDGLLLDAAHPHIGYEPAAGAASAFRGTREPLYRLVVEM
jgi:hypothetical protein